MAGTGTSSLNCVVVMTVVEVFMVLVNVGYGHFTVLCISRGFC